MDLEKDIKIERYVDAAAISEDMNAPAVENSIRPNTFADYPGQNRAKENLQIYVQAARKRGKALDHVLLHGPPGLGKTTLAKIIATELAVPYYQTSGLPILHLFP